MRFRVFQFPLPADDDLPELNAFLAANRVATVTQHLVTTSGLDRRGAPDPAATTPTGGRTFGNRTSDPEASRRNVERTDA